MSILIASLAVWYVTHSLVWMDGPFGLFLRLRVWLDPSGIKAPGSPGQLFSCVFCLSMWTSLIGLGLAGALINWTSYVAWIEFVEMSFVLAAGSAFLEGVYQALYSIINHFEE